MRAHATAYKKKKKKKKKKKMKKIKKKTLTVKKKLTLPFVRVCFLSSTGYASVSPRSSGLQAGEPNA